MNGSVVIKSFPHGINLILNPEIPFEELLIDIGEKFKESSSFFKKASMALSFEGRQLSDTEEIMVMEAIMKNCDVHIMCIVGHDDEKDRNYIKALDRMDYQLNLDNDGKVYKGSLKNGESLDSKNNIFVLGDVNPGCIVHSEQSIIVLGGLYGEAYAGSKGAKDAVIIALEMEPEKLFIGDFKYKSSKPSKWGIRQKVQPKIAYLKKDKLNVESLTKELLSSILEIPQN